MHADICDSDDKASIARFCEVLQEFNAELKKGSWALGVDVSEFQIGQDTLTVFSDAWSIDIETSDELVARITNAMKKK